MANTLAIYRAANSFKPDIIHSFARLLYLTPLLPTNYPKIMSYQREPGVRAIKLAASLGRDTIQFTGCSDYITSLGRSRQNVPASPQWHTIHNFIEPDRFTFVESLADDAPLVFLSRIERVKGVHTAIKIARATNSKLIIAGNRPDLPDAKEYWETRVKPEIDEKQISYIGPVNDEQKNELLGSARALVLPIEWDEPFGIVFAESLACGTPVITSAGRGAAPEIISDGETGFLTSSTEEAIQRVSLLSDLSRKHCRETAIARFSLDLIAGRYISLYRETIEEKKQG
jgi:glycosyltransferase involved in cell wall biosynthesis